MPETLSLALATPGLSWMALTILAAGLVRGFTGFGTALIFVPIATQFLPAADVILIMAATGLFSTAVLVPRAWKTADHSEVGALALAAALMVPVGLWLMSMMDGLVVRWIITGFVSITLVAVISGWRWRGTLGRFGRMAVGGGAGIMGGMTGLTGPVVIVFYLANARSAQAVRSNTILFLAAMDVVLIVSLALSGHVNPVMLSIALVLGVPYLITSLIGQALFNPAYERVYRVMAYSISILAVISGLPLLD